MARFGSGTITDLITMGIMRHASRWAVAVLLMLASAAFATSGRRVLTADLVVVGAGVAGLSAALEAARKGSSVVVIDIASVFGGHAVMSAGTVMFVDTPVQRGHGIADSPELAYDDFNSYGGDADPAWARYYSERSRADVYDWLYALGVRFDRVSRYPGNSVARGHQTIGAGMGLVAPIFRECLRYQKIRFLWNHKVVALERQGARVVGVRTESLRDGNSQLIRSRAVVVATGGYQSNIELVLRFWPAGVPVPPRILAGSGANSLGSALTFAREAGAAIERMDHQWNYETGLPDPRHPGTDRGLNAGTRDAVWVNRSAKRFVNEGRSRRERLEALLAQPGATYWMIFDSRGRETFGVSGTDWTDHARVDELLFSTGNIIKSATTIEELAEKLDLPARELAATIARYNSLVAAGEDTEFGRFHGGGIVPRPVSVPPFYGAQFFPLARKSMGGIRVDRACRVLDTRGRAIPGLFAAGEAAGFGGMNGRGALEGTFLGPAIAMGRIAGRTAAGMHSPRRQMPLRPVAGRGIISQDIPVAQCEACHALREIVTAARPGYWHFERSHKVVVERKLNCGGCHSEIKLPYDPASHRISRAAQMDTCKRCH